MTRRTPHLSDIAYELGKAADDIREHGDKAVEYAALLAARGWSTGGTGDGGARSNKELTSVEQAATNPTKWDGEDDRLADNLHDLWQATIRLRFQLADIFQHADPASADRAVRQPGTGHCLACGRYVAGSTQTDRLKAGFCVACYKAWQRTPQPRDRASFIKDRWEFTHPPEVEHVDPKDPSTVKAA